MNTENFYKPKSEPVILEIPALPFAVIEGTGNPNGEAFALATSALYAFSYTVKMSYKSAHIPEGYTAYKVFPLEGIWDLVDKTKGSQDKDNYAYRLMIRQPAFLTSELFERFKREALLKKGNPRIADIRFEVIREGLVCQALHLGAYDEEPATFSKMASYIQAHGYTRASLTHHEIYLSDPRKTQPDKLKTLLRVTLR